ncbi:MAG: hypothetical protein E7438_01660 [Ruminococcaceae bacterium]|nr:hypothetical protein [Oscillospiraceae bacterium]
MKTFDERRKSVNEYVTKIKARRRRTAIMATSICLAVAVLSAVLFIPYNTTPPDVSMYADSEYYAVIQQLNLATFQKPKYKNNFEALCDLNLWRVKNPGAAPGEDLLITSPVAKEEYVETTDNQVQGVVEADLMKRSDRYIYHLYGFELRVYEIAGEDTALVGSYNVGTEHEIGDGFNVTTSAEMFLSPDCNTVTLILIVFDQQMESCTKLVNLDVTDPSNITPTEEVYFVGRLVSARMAEGQILLAYNYSVSKSNIDFSDPATYVPQYGTPENMTCIPAEDIVCPDQVSSSRYTVLCKIDGKSLDVKGATALLSYSNELYVSRDTIYATHGYSHKNSEVFNNEYKQTDMTEITGVSYAGDGLEILGTVTLEGSVKDQYSMDQYDGMLRVVTSTAITGFQERFFGEYVSVTANVTERNVNLYCVDLSDWQIAASVIGFAPEGEEATSVRFDGVNAYVCTAEVITLTDPVYFFDLSDISNITYTDTGLIDGFSTSLIQLGDGYLLGIGYGEERNLKIEIYEQTQDGVVSVCAYEKSASFTENYKSYFIDRERNLIGLAIDVWGSNESVYILLHFDGYELNVLKSIRYEGNRDRVRAALIDGDFYVLSKVLRVEPLQ